MMQGMYAAISGLEAHQTMLDVTANNLANVDTIGYKAQRTMFVDELSQLVRSGTGPTATNGGSNALQVGLGAQVGSIGNLMTGGSFQSTGDPLDVAIQGPGYLRVADWTGGGPGAIDYTRAGNLQINSAGYLTTSSGLYVLDANDQRIQMGTGGTNVAIGEDGTVTYTDTTGASQSAGQISLATFPNEAGLERAGGSLWTANTAITGTPNVGNPNSPGFGQTISGELEMSNVDLATEFTNMITAERGYQANSRVITTADEMLQTAVQMKQ